MPDATQREDYNVIAEEVVASDVWNSMFDEWKSGVLKSRWAVQRPDLFDALDVACQQPAKYFAEWYAAILLKQKFGFLSLVSKFGHHGCRSHHRKQQVLARCLTPEQHRYVITDPIGLFGHKTGWPDLFVYKADYSSCFFCEVKGPKDKLRPGQVQVFEALQAATGVEVTIFQFYTRRASIARP